MLPPFQQIVLPFQEVFIHIWKFSLWRENEICSSLFPRQVENKR
ncbi:hypothetical protein HMPREF0373_00425 [Eubacterium ramulus ATCC 29099]|uniref:Uncharacterized protein n=1 Tax=Eubacterium ramulus ATCC 29099 TaxID=1256908 RepID=U2Q474_EUBRA|nr:hypothetical protein HMPREF0373_00425 [Eubacterium ramulus ATCC 29099]